MKLLIPLETRLILLKRLKLLNRPARSFEAPGVKWLTGLTWAGTLETPKLRNTIGIFRYSNLPDLAVVLLVVDHSRKKLMVSFTSYTNMLVPKITGLAWCELIKVHTLPILSFQSNPYPQQFLVRANAKGFAFFLITRKRTIISFVFAKQNLIDFTWPFRPNYWLGKRLIPPW